MPYSFTERRLIYDKTSGRCHLCHRKLAITNYASVGQRGAWEVEHSRPRARGGTDHLNNLFAACIDCNRDKSTVSTRTVRRWYGTNSAPLSKRKRQTIQNENATICGILGGVIGCSVGPLGIAFGAAVGAAIGKNIGAQKI